MRILITGASGFVGGAVAKRLIRAGHEVIGTATAAPAASSAGLQWVQWHSGDGPIPEIEYSSLDAIIHLASPRDRGKFPEAAPANLETSVIATVRLVEQARMHGLRFLLASTGDVVAAGPAIVNENDDALRPVNFYGAALASAELLVRQYMSTTSAAILRLFHPFGFGGDAFLINRLVRRVAGGQEITIDGRNGIQLNPVWIEDVVDGFIIALANPVTGRFHLSGPDLMSFRALVGVIGGIVGREVAIKSPATQPDGGHAGSYERARQILGYNPRIGLEEGVRLLARNLSAEPGR